MIKLEQWVQVETEVRECPVLSTYVNYVRAQHLSREDALVAVAIALSRERRDLIAERQRSMAAAMANESSRSGPAALRMSEG